MRFRKILGSETLTSAFYKRENTSPYATHIPILTYLLHNQKPKNILEYGGGEFSTSLFLDQETFPFVRQLTTVEDNKEWAEKLNNQFKGNPKWNLAYVNPTEKYDLNLALNDFDLIFIDDCLLPEDRAKTVDFVLTNTTDTTVIVHDFEKRKLNSKRKMIHYSFIGTYWKPQTGILSSSKPSYIQGLKEFCGKVKSEKIELTDYRSQLKLIKT